MRVEPLCRIAMHYSRASWHQPYGSERGEEALGFGDGQGEVSGDIDGTVVWANYPRRRDDGVWTPNLRGFLTTTEGEEILISVHGQSILEKAPGRRRAVTARVELTTEADSYRWLNTCFLVGEGEIDEEREDWWLTTYVCINEEAQGPPALGIEPPARFRQHGSAPS
jgi:Protein of unknown function (DUF3237)